MKISLRPISHSAEELRMGHCLSYPPLKTDAISCTFNMDGFSPMKAALRAHGFDPECFASNRQLEKWHSDGFCVHVHKNHSPLLLTTSRTRTWDDAPQATREIIKAAEAEGCKSLCMTHFSFLPGKFPKSAFCHCLRMAADPEQQGPLKRVVLDVDDRHIELAQRLLGELHAKQAYAQRHSLGGCDCVNGAEAGSSDFQRWLAAKLLTRSTQDDRCVEALKWLLLAKLTRSTTNPGDEPYNLNSAFEFLAAGMSGEQTDDAFALAQNWLEQKLSDPSGYTDMVPEFRKCLAPLETCKSGT